jgi:hypothetical protein
VSIQRLYEHIRETYHDWVALEQRLESTVAYGLNSWPCRKVLIDTVAAAGSEADLSAKVTFIDEQLHFRATSSRWALMSDGTQTSQAAVWLPSYNALYRCNSIGNGAS